jgi:hypothetical protein
MTPLKCRLAMRSAPDVYVIRVLLRCSVVPMGLRRVSGSHLADGPTSGLVTSQGWFRRSRMSP